MYSCRVNISFYEAHSSCVDQQINSLSIWDVLNTQASIMELPVIGSIYIPNVDMKLPIIKGVGKSALAAGAGTMKPDLTNWFNNRS